MAHRVWSHDQTDECETDCYPWLLRVAGNDRKKDSGRFLNFKNMKKIRNQSAN